MWQTLLAQKKCFLCCEGCLVEHWNVEEKPSYSKVIYARQILAISFGGY